MTAISGHHTVCDGGKNAMYGGKFWVRSPTVSEKCIVYRKIGSVYSVYVCIYVYVLICTYERERYYTHIYVQSGGARHPIV
jgi:hypothetical protein